MARRARGRRSRRRGRPACPRSPSTSCTACPGSTPRAGSGPSTRYSTGDRITCRPTGSPWITAAGGDRTASRAFRPYWALARSAAARGYEHYEISNYALPGCRSRHNQVYWRRREYAALGPGACGFLGRVRYSNVRSTERYCELLEGAVLPVAEHEVLTDGQAAGERLILGLRTRDGVPEEWLGARAATDPALAARLEGWRAAGLLERVRGRARLSERGFLLSDALFVELVQV